MYPSLSGKYSRNSNQADGRGLMESAKVKEILQSAKTVAVIGVSGKPDRASHQVAAYLIEQTHFDIYLINPAATEEILGQQVYKSLAELPIVPDIVNVFRKGEDMPGIFAKEFPVIEKQAAGKTWWMQLGIENLDVAKLAADAGMQVVMNRCIKVDYQNLIAEGK
jgi:predicted CoA-binding protein